LKIVTALYHETEIEKLIESGVSVLLLNTDCLSTRANRVFSRDEMSRVIKKIHMLGKEAYLNMNTMIHESDVPMAADYLAYAKSLDVDGILIFDWTYYPLAKNIGFENRLIYSPGTLTTNLYDPWFYEKLGIKGVTVAREITLDSLGIILQNRKAIEISFFGHGMNPMFYSRRPLITNFLIEKDLTDLNLLNQENLMIIESNRVTTEYPIYEDRFGTHIFRNRRMQSFDEILFLKSILSDFIIERFMLEDEELYDSLAVYQERLSVHDFNEKYPDRYDSGFYYKKTNLRMEVKP